MTISSRSSLEELTSYNLADFNLSKLKTVKHDVLVRFTMYLINDKLVSTKSDKSAKGGKSDKRFSNSTVVSSEQESTTLDKSKVKSSKIASSGEIISNDGKYDSESDSQNVDLLKLVPLLANITPLLTDLNQTLTGNLNHNVAIEEIGRQLQEAKQSHENAIELAKQEILAAVTPKSGESLVVPIDNNNSVIDNSDTYQVNLPGITVDSNFVQRCTDRDLQNTMSSLKDDIVNISNKLDNYSGIASNKGANKNNINTKDIFEGMDEKWDEVEKAVTRCEKQVSEFESNIATTIDQSFNKYSKVADILKIPIDVESLNNESSIIPFNTVQTQIKNIVETASGNITKNIKDEANVLKEAISEQENKLNEKIETIFQEANGRPTYSNIVGTNEQADNYIENERLKTTSRPLNSISKVASSNRNGQNVQSIEPRKPTVDPAKTIIIGNIQSRKLIQHASIIKSEFNKRFNFMEIKTCFPTRTGSLMIELTKEQDVRTVLDNWQPSFFTLNSEIKSSGNRREQGTTVRVMNEKRKEGVIKSVMKDIGKEQIEEELNDKFPGIIAHRFEKNGNKLHIVKLTFTNSDQLEQAIVDGVNIGFTHFKVEILLHKPRVMQC